MSTPSLGEDTPQFSTNLPARHRLGKGMQVVFFASTLVGILMLILLLYNVLDRVAGYAAIVNDIEPETLAINGIPIENLAQSDLVYILEQNLTRGRFRKLDADKPLMERSREEIYDLVIAEVVSPDVVNTWPLFDSLLKKSEIEAQFQVLKEEDYPTARLEWVNWLTTDFITRPQSSDPETAGIRTAILGSLWVILVTITFAFPVGVAAAVYLEEYATDNWINRLIRTNINNLAGVPSIIYGILGLAIFVRALEPFTSGVFFGAAEAGTTLNGRTILSAGLTLGILILPVIIINAQEAIRTVPNSLRQASYGVGASKWQTIWHHVLPNAIPGILTGTILAMSRALGETAPLVVVGASTYITFDPDGIFSKFTILPIQIYQWTSRPQAEFRNIAAAAIVVLLILLVTLNATAILLRNRFSKKL